MKKLLSYIMFAVLWGTSTNAIKLVNEMEYEVTFQLVRFAGEPVYNYVSVNSIKLGAKKSLEWPIETKIQSLKEKGKKVNDMYICAKHDVTFGTYFGNRPNESRSIQCKERIRSPYRLNPYCVDRIRVPFADNEYYDAVCTDVVCGDSKDETFAKTLESLKDQTIKIERHRDEVHWEKYPIVIPYMALEPSLAVPRMRENATSPTIGEAYCGIF